MAIVQQQNERNYSASTREVPFVVQLGWTEVKATFTKPNWPASECLLVEIIRPDGNSLGTVGFAGGLNRQGVAEGSIGIRDRAGLTPGTYIVRATNTVALRMAITVEAT